MSHEEVYSSEMRRRQTEKNLTKLLYSLALLQLGGEHHVGVEVVGDQRRWQKSEIQLQYRGHAVNVM